ncbi:class I SAM-dependent methyltransferase [Candidatus Pelagibacter sp. HIMB1695]|uniref:class I SAM-dependent methyltransferase n=1 Tax=Candidatus Pelagibacter sp. HIMB1695 TaxID=3413364 RepID=UPI003F8776F2
MKDNILLKVNKVYSEQNPSKYFNNTSKKNLNILFRNRKNFLIEKLKLPTRLFKNSELLDLGCGTGQNTISYDWNGAKCTLVEYDKSSSIQARNLFKKYSKNRFKVINKDLFKFKTSKKFDFVVSNGVAHHTSDVVKNINLAIKYLKNDGLFILGLGESNGFFQRNLQRYILYSLTSDTNELIKLSKLLFNENLNRAKKFGGRSIKEIIFDTYINPKIETLSFKEVESLFKKNDLYLYSSDEDTFDLKKIYGFNKFYFRLKTGSKLENKSFLFNSLVNFSYKGNSDKILNKNIDLLNQILKIQDNISKKINNQSVKGFKKIKLNKNIEIYEEKINKLEKIDVINKKNIFQFILELKNIFKILNLKDKKTKIKLLKKTIKKNSRLFKGHCGKGMNYFVGMKVQKYDT